MIHKNCRGKVLEILPQPEMGDHPALWISFECEKCGRKFSRHYIENPNQNEVIKNEKLNA